MSDRKKNTQKSKILDENILLAGVISFWCLGHKNFTYTCWQFPSIKIKIVKIHDKQTAKVKFAKTDR